MYQTQVIRPEAVRIGSAKIEVGNSEAALMNLGSLRSVQLQEQWERVTINGDNVGRIKEFIRNHIATLTFNWLELDLESAQKFRGGIDIYSTVAGTPVSVTDEALGIWTQGQPIKLGHKNGSGSIVTGIAIKAGGSALEAGTDYQTYVGDGSNGESGATYIVPITAQTLTITADYTYTPNAAKQITTGGRTEISPNVVRVTNVNEDGKKLEVTIFKSYSTSGINLTLPSDDADDIWATPVNIEGVCDASRAAGAQLMRIVDEQSVA